MKSQERSSGGRKRLTDEEREKRRIARNERRRHKYADMTDEKRDAVLAAQRTRYTDRRDERIIGYPSQLDSDSRNLLRGVLAARRKVSGVLSAKAEWIIETWRNGQPKIGWKDDAQEIIAAQQEL